MVVVDEQRAPLPDVEVDAFVDGAFVALTTAADGTAQVDGRAALLTVRPDGHDWTTVLDPGPVVVVVAAATPDRSTVSGIRGVTDFSKSFARGDLDLALTGLALPSLVDLDASRVLGVPATAHFALEGITGPEGEDDVVPSSLEIDLGTTPVRGGFLALGDAVAWSIGAELSLADVGPLLSSPEPRRFGPAWLARSLGTFFSSRLEAGLDTGLAADTGPRPADGAPDDEWPFHDVTVAPSAPAFESVHIHAHALPEGTRDLLAAAFVRLPDGGFVPLGFTDASLDRALTQGEDSLRDFDLGFAPPHDGAEGRPVVVAVAALDLDAVAPGAPYPGVASLTLFPLDGAGTLDASAILPPPHARFDGAAVDVDDQQADAWRVDLAGPGGAWHVWSPSPPSFSLADLTADGAGLDRADAARAAAFVLRAGAPAPLSSTAAIDDVVAQAAFAPAQPR